MKRHSPHIRSYLLCLIATFSLVTKDCLAYEKDELLADFIYNLVNYVNWEDKTEVSICAYGHDDVSMNLKKIGSQANLRGNNLSKIKNINMRTDVGFKDILTCDLLYIANSEERNVLLILAEIKHRSIITMSSLENFIARGGVLEFKVMRRKVQLKIGQTALKDTGITLSPVLLMSGRSQQ